MHKMPDRITDGPADDWPGDAGPDEIAEREAQALRHIDNGIIAEWLTDDPRFLAMIWSHIIIMLRPDRTKYIDHADVGRKLAEHITAEAEKYLDNHPRGKS